MLTRLIGKHPDVSAFDNTGVPEDEGQHLQSIYPPAWRFGGPGKFGFKRNARLTEKSPLATRESARRIYEEWSRHWKDGRSVRLEKSPPNVIRMRFLQTLFPGARFVILVRHPVAVGYATQKMSKSSIFSLVAHWAACYRIFEQDRAWVRNVRLIRYEDFVLTPEAALADIFGFLDLPSRRVAVDVRTDVNARYFEQWLGAMGSPARRLLALLLTAMYGRLFDRHGYRLVPEKESDKHYGLVRYQA